MGTMSVTVPIGQGAGVEGLGGQYPRLLFGRVVRINGEIFIVGNAAVNDGDRYARRRCNPCPIPVWRWL